jgi:hypothetical protein
LTTRLHPDHRQYTATKRDKQSSAERRINNRLHHPDHRYWEQQLASKSPSLTAALWRTSGGLLIAAVPFKLTCDASQFVAPVFLNLLLANTASGGPPTLGYVYAGMS